MKIEIKISYNFWWMTKWVNNPHESSYRELRKLYYNIVKMWSLKWEIWDLIQLNPVIVQHNSLLFTIVTQGGGGYLKRKLELLCRKHIPNNYHCGCMGRQMFIRGPCTYPSSLVQIFYRQLGCLAFSLRSWPKIKQFLSNCPASDWPFSKNRLIFTKPCKNQLSNS